MVGLSNSSLCCLLCPDPSLKVKLKLTSTSSSLVETNSLNKERN